MKWSFPWICPVVPLSGRPYKSTLWKLQGCRLHTIPLLSLTLQLSAHQEWEGNKPGMALHPCPHIDTSSSSMCYLLAGRCINNHHVWWIIFTHGPHLMRFFVFFGQFCNAPILLSGKFGWVRSLPVLMVSKFNLRKTLKSLPILKSFWSIRISCT